MGRTFHLLPLLFSLVPLALAACGGGATLASPDGGGGPDATSPLVGVLKEAGQYDPGGDAGAFSASQVQAALAHCHDPHGSPVTVTTGNDEEALLVGAWVLCPEGDAGGSADVQTVFSPGMILAPSGAWTRLASDGNGGLVAATGVQNQGQWGASCETSSDITNSQPCVSGGMSNIDVGIQAASRDTSAPACYGGPISFESSPRRMYVVDFPAESCDVNWDGGTFDLWLVPL